MLRRKKNKKTGKSQWALVSRSTPGKVLQWFGANKPSSMTLASAERRVQYFKNKGG